MDKQNLLERLEKVNWLGKTSKVQRMLANPLRYWNTIFFKILVYPRAQKSKVVFSDTFFGESMKVLLPSSTDIHLTGGKSHPSEIRLAKFIIKQLERGECFVDVGAHYGYFSLLAAKLVGSKGKVISFEASKNTYAILSKNIAKYKCIKAHHQAITSEVGDISFYEFPNLYSEYNTIDVKQFENAKWFVNSPPEKVNVKTIKLDDYFKEHRIHPKLIKIDVEGAEYEVIKGMQTYLTNHTPSIVMEYLSSTRGNSNHQQATQLLTQLGFKTYSIKEDGGLEICVDADAYLKDNGIDSDNLVFQKTN